MRKCFNKLRDILVLASKHKQPKPVSTCNDHTHSLNPSFQDVTAQVTKSLGASVDEAVVSKPVDIITSIDIQETFGLSYLALD